MSEAALEGRIALVTGAARRLGRDLALALGRAGADVVVHCNRHQDDAERVAEEIRGLGRRAWTVRADFLDPGGPDRVLRALRDGAGRLDLLVNNVGNYLVKPPEQTTPDELRELLECNLVAPHALIRGSLPLFPPAGGNVINLGYAGVESLRAHTAAMAYQISKTALLVLTRTYARRLAPRGIRVNMISPGHLENSVDLPADIESAIPLGRAGRPDDIVRALRFLVRDDGYVTGVNIDVAGGYRL